MPIRSLLLAFLVVLSPTLGVAADERALDRAAPSAHVTRAPFDYATLVNRDPAALPVGIRFMSSVPLETRRTLIDDIAWLNDLGPLPPSPILGDLIGVRTGNLTGAHLAAWLVEAIRVLVGSDFCTPGARLVLSRSRDSLTFVDTQRDQCVGDDTVWAWAEVLDAAARRGREADLVYIDGELLAPRRIGPFLSGLVAINETSLASSYDEVADLPRQVRLVLLIHEAFHALHDAFHISCGPRWMLGPEAITFGLLGWDEGDRDCDQLGYAGSYAIEAETMRLFTELCDGCTDEERRALIYHEVESWSAVGISSFSAISIPGGPAFKDTIGLVDRAFRIVPPRRLFAAMLEGATVNRDLCEDAPCREEWTRYRGEVEAALAVLDAAAAAGKLPSLWADPALADPVRPGLLDTGATARWIAAARNADGYNVPLRFLFPCEELTESCPGIGAALHGERDNGYDIGWTGNDAAATLVSDGLLALADGSIGARKGGISDQTRSVLDDVAAALFFNPYWRVAITAEAPDPRIRDRLQAAARTYLIAAGISPNRVETGHAEPAADGAGLFLRLVPTPAQLEPGR